MTWSGEYSGAQSDPVVQAKDGGRMRMPALNPDGSTKRADLDGLDEGTGTPSLVAHGCDAGNVQGTGAWLGQSQTDDFSENLALLKRVEESVHHVS